MPSSIGSSTAGCFLRLTRSFCSTNSRSLDLLAAQEASCRPTSLISTLRSICRTMSSMCLSLIFTPCSR